MEKNIKMLIGQNINDGLAKRTKQQKELAQYLGIKDNVVSYFCKGERVPNHEQIIKIAEFLNTSTDFIYGKTKVIDNQNVEVRAVSDYTGLSEKAVNTLHSNCSKDIKQIIELMINDSYGFKRILGNRILSFYIQFDRFKQKSEYIMSDGTITDIDYFHCWDDLISYNNLCLYALNSVSSEFEKLLRHIFEDEINLMNELLNKVKVEYDEPHNKQGITEKFYFNEVGDK